MITAAEALRLPTALLTAEEKTAADVLDAEIDEVIRKGYVYSGINFDTKETRGSVIAEIGRRLRAAGYKPTILMLTMVNKFDPSVKTPVGFRIELPPTDAAYEEADRLALS